MEEDEETSDDSTDHYGSIEAQRQENIYIVYLRRNGDMSDSEIIDATKKFAAIIQESDTYKEYLHQREKIKTQPELYDKVNEYRQKNFDLQNESDSEELFDRMEAFEQEYAKFRENPLVSDFLRAELAFVRMMQDVNVLLASEIDFE